MNNKIIHISVRSRYKDLDTKRCMLRNSNGRIKRVPVADLITKAYQNRKFKDEQILIITMNEL